MPTPKVLLVYNRSSYLRHRLGTAPTVWMRRREFKPYVQTLKDSHWAHYGALARVKEALQERGLEVVEALRHDLARESFADGRFGLVVAVGGDGTFLDASHWTRRVPVLGVNSDPGRSVARFSGCTIGKFGALLDAYGLGRVKPARLPRLALKLNGKTLKWPILNDILVAARTPAATSHYVIRVGGRREEQLSSGVWISTAAGSTAANRSAGGKTFAPEKPVFQYLVREPNEKKFGARRLLGGVLPKSRNVEITSYMPEGMIYLDGPSLSMPFTIGDTLRITLSAPPLSVIGLKK